MPGLLSVASAAQIDILPHQLEPALAILRGRGCRILIADEVGLGKTIQAALVIAELRARGFADRVLILTPPGLRDQWHDELSNRFQIDAVTADFLAVRRRAAVLAPDVNPWTTWSVAIASIDYVKRPEVLRSVLTCRWDVIVIDEAHRVANDGDRRDASVALTSRAAYVVLLTATPHSGDAAAFHTLCELGAQGDRLLIFRRTKSSLGSARTRKVHRLPVRASSDERKMLTKLDAFARAVLSDRHGNREAWIALAVLRKRALSGAHALHLSVARRLAALNASPQHATQLVLPLDDTGETIADDEPPSWDEVLSLRSSEQERTLLAALADAAAKAARAESKVAAVRRLLRRISEPVIIFTEYRDTLAHLARCVQEPAALLHGGLARDERIATLHAFAGGAQRLLLTTDAAAEGLNLHHRCRTVINIELPWNPMRLEQRIGRVDRIGQRRTVHAFHLIGADLGEIELADELRRRIAQARSTIGAPDPLDGASIDDGVQGESACDREDVTQELARLSLMRSLRFQPMDHRRPLVATARNRHTRRRLGSNTLQLWETAIVDAREQVLATQLTATCTASGSAHCTSADVQALTANWQASARHTLLAFAETGARRAAAIAKSIDETGVESLQPGLFDRRAHFAHSALQAAHDEALVTQTDRIAALTRAGALTTSGPRVRLVLEP